MPEGTVADGASLSPHYVESHMRRSSSQLEVDAIVRSSCGRFEAFRSTRTRLLTSGKGYDVMLFVAHVEYVRLLEEKVKGLLAGIGVTQEQFVQALTNQDGDVVVQELKHQLTVYQDFDSFAEMMEDKFNVLFLPSTVAQADNAESGTPSTEGAQQPSFSGAKKIVRVLWDVENIQVPKRLGGLRTVAALSSFLRSVNLMGQGVDARITAFFLPTRMPKGVVQELDKAAVEMVWVSSKREDADRKLGMRIMQEMAVLPPASTTFVVISSDADFRTHIQQLSNQGFAAIVIHDAPESNAVWTETLVMHASAAYRWSKLLDDFAPADSPSPGGASDVGQLGLGSGLGLGLGLAGGADSQDEASNGVISGNGSGNESNTGSKSGGKSGGESSTAGDDVQAHVQDANGRWVQVALPRAQACGLRQGKVLTWKGPFGFVSSILKLDPAGLDEPPNVLITRIYVHNSVLPKPQQQSVEYGHQHHHRINPAKGQLVQVLVAPGDRGLFAQTLSLQY